MLTKTQVNKLEKILEHGSWYSSMELIFAAFTNNPVLQSPPPHSFAMLTLEEYDLVMAYGMSQIVKEHEQEEYKQMVISDYDEDTICSSEIKLKCMYDRFKTDSTILFDFETEVTPELYKPRAQPVKGDYNSIWGSPPSEIEDSLIDDVDYLLEEQPPENNNFAIKGHMPVKTRGLNRKIKLKEQ